MPVTIMPIQLKAWKSIEMERLKYNAHIQVSLQVQVSGGWHWSASYTEADLFVCIVSIVSINGTELYVLGADCEGAV